MAEKAGFFMTFKPSYIQNVKECQDVVIIKSIGVESYDQISHSTLSKRSFASKDTLCTWLDQICALLNECCIPLLECILPVYEECEELKTEKIKDQSKIIELHTRRINEQK